MNAINGRISAKEGLPAGIDDPGDFCFRPGVVNRGGDRKGVNDIAHRAGLDQKEGTGPHKNGSASVCQAEREFFRELGFENRALCPLEIVGEAT